MGRSEIQQGGLQAQEFGGNQVDLITQVQADVRGDLIVAGAAGVQLFTHGTDTIGEAGLDVHVDIFQFYRPVKLIVFYVGLDGLQALDDDLALRRGQHPNLGQHRGVGNGAGDVLSVHAAVKANRSGEGFDKGVRRFVKTPGPGFAGVLIHSGKLPITYI